MSAPRIKDVILEIQNFSEFQIIWSILDLHLAEYLLIQAEICQVKRIQPEFLILNKTKMKFDSRF
jgi:hypothetical protein